MRRMMVAATVLVAIWSGYWFVGSYAMQRAAVAWFAGQAAQGYVAQAASVVVRGYPSRFDLTAEEVTLADPATGLGWKAPFAQILSLSYKPWHVIAALPNSQTITMPGQDITLLSDKLQASVRMTPNANLTLDLVVVVGSDLSATSTLGWGLRAAEVHLASQRDESNDAVYRLGLDIKALAPDPGMMAALPDSNTLPVAIDLIRMDATATFSAPFDRRITKTRPTLQRLDVKEALIKWGSLTGFANGTVSADANGVAEGKLDLRVENWRDLVPVLAAMGVIAPEFQLSLTAILANLAKDGPVLTLPLTFAKGYLSLGPIPLGPAPRMGLQP